MKHMFIVLTAVVMMILVLVVAPVAAGLSAKGDDSIASTEAIEVTEAMLETVVEPTVAETYEKPDLFDESDETDLASAEAVSAADVDTEICSDELSDISYNSECPEAGYAEDVYIDVYASDTGTGAGNYSYTDSDLDLLARLIYVENGCYWMPDWVQLYTGSVVLNRVNSPLYPSTIYDVIHDPGQYAPDKLYNDTPDMRTYENARILLEGGSQLPADVMGQNGENTGDGIYAIYHDEELGSTEYFTYVYGW